MNDNSDTTDTIAATALDHACPSSIFAARGWSLFLVVKIGNTEHQLTTPCHNLSWSPDSQSETDNVCLMLMLGVTMGGGWRYGESRVMMG